MHSRRFLSFFVILGLVFSLSGTKSLNEQNISSPCLSQSVDSKETTSVIPGGNSIGITLCMDGVLVVSTSDVTSSDGSHTSPAENAGIKPGDLIQSFNKNSISNVENLNEAVTNSNGKKTPIVIKRKNKTIETLIEPKMSREDGCFRIGAWVKDAASGIGTMTFFDPQTKTFAALGHGICNPETNEILSIDSGSIINSTIVSVDKGEKGVPGELNGIFLEDGIILGNISLNCDAGIFGKVCEDFKPDTQPIPIAFRKDTKIGKAEILSNVEGSKVDKFNIEIIKILPKSISSQKSMIIKVTDENLLNKTGGIVQGMSGSPILQNGKIVGAVTHVFINDPTRGYGIFIEDMLDAIN